MTKPKTIFKITVFLIVCLLSLTGAFAQTQTKPQAEKSYDVVLHILTASNKTSERSTVAPTLSNVVKKLKTVYSFANYRLDATFLQRVANNGSVDFKSVSNEFNEVQENTALTFLEWQLVGLQSLPDVNGQNSIQFQNFRFGQRIPLKTADVVNYESIGLNIQRFSMSENVPTIVGSLSTSKPDELTLLVLTVKPAQE